MDSWIESCEFDRRDADEEVVTIDGGIDEFERVRVEENDEAENVYIYLISKDTEMFSLEMRYGLILEEIEVDESELDELAESYLLTYANHAAAVYLEQMDLPPIQGVFSEGMSVTLTQDINTDEFGE